MAAAHFSLGGIMGGVDINLVGESVRLCKGSEDYLTTRDGFSGDVGDELPTLVPILQSKQNAEVTGKKRKRVMTQVPHSTPIRGQYSFKQHSAHRGLLGLHKPSPISHTTSSKIPGYSGFSSLAR